MTAAALVLKPYAIPRVTWDAIVRALRVGLESLRAVPPMRHSEWAAKHFKLAGESSHQRGGWEAWPFQIGILDFMGDDDIYELDVFKSKRVGYTKCLTSSIGFDIYRRRNQALWQPTDDDRDSFVKTEVDPMLDGVAVLRSARRLSKDADDTIKYKQFRDSVLHLLGGKAARAYRRITVASAKLDELSAFDQQIEKSADPFTLAEGRLEGAPFPKIICGSTPRLKGLCHLEARTELADAFMRYHIVCKHCGVEHPLIWGSTKVAHGIKWDKGQPETARHVCPHCLKSITQADYLANWVGAWVCDRTGMRYGADGQWRTADGKPCKPPRHVAVHVWAAYSPQREWSDIARQSIAAKRKLEAGDHGPMQGFVNETLAQTWEVEGERTEEHALQRRAEPYPLGVVPVGALKLTAGVDVQGNRWEVNVWGWGAGLESWIVDDQVFEGNPADDRDWEQLAIYLRRRYPSAWNGALMGIDAISIDSGHHTQAVYNFVRQQQASMRIHAIKGSSEEGRPIKGSATPVEITWRGQKWPAGLKLWVIGVDSAKDLLHGQLAIEKPGPGYVHFSADLPREWYQQLTAEQRIPALVQGAHSMRWVKRRPRNEKLDCRNYALHAAYMLGLHTMTDAAWARLQAIVQPPPDLFSPAPIVVPADQPDPAVDGADSTAPSPRVPLPAAAPASRNNTRAEGRAW